MGKDLLRVESAISATASGNLTDGKWQHDVSTALGLSGQRNPLGFAVVRFLSDTPSAVEVWNIILVLSSMLVKSNKLDPKTAQEMAWKGFSWWRDSRCPICHGRAVNSLQRTCLDCKGSGHRKMPERPEAIRDAISRLIEAEQWMEGQLAARLNGAKYSPEPDGNRVNLPALSGSLDQGFNRRSDSGFNGRVKGD